MNERLARWLARLNAPPSDANATTAGGEGIEESVYSTLAWPEWTLFALFLAAVAWAAWNYARERGTSGRGVRAGLLLIRTALLLVLLLMLQGWMFQRHRTDLPDLVLVFDVSASMAQQDTADDSASRDALLRRFKSIGLDEPTRLNLAKLLLLEKNAEAMAKLNERYRLKVYRIGSSAVAERGESLSATESLRRLSPRDDASRLGKGLREVLEMQRGRPTSAVLLFTDGVNTEGKTLSNAADYARRKTIPLYVVGLGSARPARDAAVDDVVVEPEAFVDDLIRFDARVSTVGMKGETVRLVLRRQGDSEILAEEKLTLADDRETRRMVLQHRPREKGTWNYELMLENLKDDTQPDNDRTAATIEVHDSTIRVLLVQAQPSYEFRFLKTMLERELNPRDTAVDAERGFHIVLQDADISFADTDKSALRQFPLSREELFKYDVLIIGDANPALLGRTVQENIAAFAKERGGGIIFVAGPEFNPSAYRDSPLGNLLPIDAATVKSPDSEQELIQEIRARPTPLGLSLSPLQLDDSITANMRLWSTQLPGIYWWVETPDVRSGAQVLLEHPTKTGSQGTPLPLVSMQYVGMGKVVFQAFDGSYRWRLRAGDKYFSRYWIQMIRYLSRSHVLSKDRVGELTADREKYLWGEPVLLRMRFLDDRQAPADDDGVSFMLEKTEGKRTTVAASRSRGERGIFEATINDLAEGRYRAWLISPTVEGSPPATEFRVVAPPGETARLELDEKELRAAAKISGGEYRAAISAGNLWDRLPPGREVRIESMPPHPLWNSPLLASAFVVLLTTEWLLRKRAGML